MNSYTLRNFRVFNDDGGTIHFAPLTILTGCNSSGKSSFTKSIKLVQPLLCQLAKNLKDGSFHSFTDYYANFTCGQHKLGSFEKVINWLSDDDEFTVEYSTQVMAYSGRSVRVAITFSPLDTAPDAYSPEQDTWQVCSIDRNFTDKPRHLNRNRQIPYAGIRRILISDDETAQLIYEYHHGTDLQENAAIHTFQRLADMLTCFVDESKADDDAHVICRRRIPIPYKRFRYEHSEAINTSDSDILSTWGTRADTGSDIRVDIEQFAELVCTEALCAAEDITNAYFIEIDRSNLQRIYLFENQGTSFNTNLERYIQIPDVITIDNPDNPNATSGNSYVKGTFINKWLKRLLDVRLTVEPAPEGIGIYVYLIKTVNRRKVKVSIADMGYGITPLIAMLVRIEYQICQYVSWSGTAYGRYNAATIFIEEPESNLHPNFQSLLADIFVDAASNYPIRFVFETHSEYFVRKFQVLVASRHIKPDQISINYLYDPDPRRRPANEPQVKHINIKENGGLTARFGTGFFDESTRLSTELFK